MGLDLKLDPGIPRCPCAGEVTGQKALKRQNGGQSWILGTLCTLESDLTGEAVVPALGAMGNWRDISKVAMTSCDGMAMSEQEMEG